MNNTQIHRFAWPAWSRTLEASSAALCMCLLIILSNTLANCNMRALNRMHGGHVIQLGGMRTETDAVVFSDELNHASIIDGARLAGRAGAVVHVYRHNDLAHLERLLAACPPGRRRLVVTDSLFSMDGARNALACATGTSISLSFNQPYHAACCAARQLAGALGEVVARGEGPEPLYRSRRTKIPCCHLAGDFADLRGLAELRRRHGFLLAIDEAHATLVCGDR